MKKYFIILHVHVQTTSVGADEGHRSLRNLTWAESNENHQYQILISLRLDGNPLLGFKWIEWFKQLHIKDNVCICSHVILCKTYANTVFGKPCQSKSWIGADCRKIGDGQELTWRPTTLTLISRFRKHFLKWTIF